MEKANIAFLSRVHGKCEDSENCKNGDMLVNLLQVDAYAQPVRFKLYTTEYEACMEEGCRDDVIHSAFVIKVNSMRGVDVALAVQYNDGVVFDCITSTKQLPIMVPLCPSEYLMDKDEHEFTKDSIKMIKVNMQMDDEGALYWLVNVAADRICILR